jgi:hypothetical protein
MNQSGCSEFGLGAGMHRKIMNQINMRWEEAKGRMGHDGNPAPLIEPSSAP